MLKNYIQGEKKFNGAVYKPRRVVVDELFLERLRKVPEAIVVSSFRTLEEQKAMVAKGASKTLQSNHRRGMAVDCVNWEAIQDNMRAVGLINDISWDKNHFAYDGETKAAKYPLYNIDNSTPAADTVTTETLEKKPMNKDLVKILSEICGEDFGKDLNESEQKEAAERLKEIKEEIAKNQVLLQTNQSLYEENIRLTDKLNDFPTKEQVALTFDPLTKGKISKGAAIAAGGAALTYLIQSLSGMDYGVYTPMIVALCGVAINTIKEYVTGR